MVTLILAISLFIPTAAFSAPLQVVGAETSSNDFLKPEPIKLKENETADDVVKNPAQPDIYTLRKDYKVERDGKYEINYQPYVATVGAAANEDQKAKVKKKIIFPFFPGYTKPHGFDSFNIDYDTVKAEAEKGEKTGKQITGFTYSSSQDFNYKANKNKVKIKHVFQDVKDFNKYGKKPGNTEDIVTEEEGNIGSKLEIAPLEESKIKGFIPETAHLDVQIPQDTSKFSVEYRYNRAHFNVTFDSKGGTSLPDRTLYYGQTIPTIDANSIPVKLGATFQGWKPSIDLQGKLNGQPKTFKANEVIKAEDGTPIKDLQASLEMPAENVKFTSAWKENDKANYTVLFWAEKADHDDKAEGRDKYDYIGTHVIKNVETGSRPDLSKEPRKGINFSDIPESIVEIDNQFSRYYVFNSELTQQANQEKDSQLIKEVLSTGETVYNVYFDRRVYTLYFTKNTTCNGCNSFWPTIERDKTIIGEKGKPYAPKVRFNQRMTDIWPKDPLEVKNFKSDFNSTGWTAVVNNGSTIYRDTPPYRLSRELFIDADDIKRAGGYVDTVPFSENKYSPRHIYDIVLGVTQGDMVMPHHIDFYLQGFDDEDDKRTLDFDSYNIKSDTSNSAYVHRAPTLLGFKIAKGENHSQFKDEDDLADIDDERREKFEKSAKYKQLEAAGIDPEKYYEDHYKLNFVSFFPGGDREYVQNGYIDFHYTRNKYSLRLNDDSRIHKADSDYATNDVKQVFYQYPLKKLKLDTTHKPAKPAWAERDWVFKGWSLDPKGQSLIKDGNETMPAHDLVLYAIWGAPDTKWNVTFDLNGGKLEAIDPAKIVKKQKTITEGDVGSEKEVTYPVKNQDTTGKQSFTFLNRQQMVEPTKPQRKGYTFLGWEVLYYQKNDKGEYTDKIDTSYRDTYGVPELYSFGNYVLSDLRLKAIWVENNMLDVRVYHHFLTKDLSEDTTKNPNPEEEIILNQRAHEYTAMIASRQNNDWILASHDELENTKDEKIKKLYKEYNDRVKFNNTYAQTLQVEPEKILENGKAGGEAKLVDNPKFKNNEFHFFYRPFRVRNYKVNYVDERGKAELEKATSDAQKQSLLEKYSILPQELVTSKARHFDARNFKPIAGWRLVSDPQQQLVYDVDEDTNAFKGINGTGSDEITFFYKDIRVIEVPKGGKTPEGYVRVTFKAGEGGSFGKDKEGNPIKELHYDVLKGMKAELLPVPQELGNGQPDENKYYVTPDENRKFINWNDKPLLQPGAVIDETGKGYYVFTAQFDWADPVTKGLVTTESFNDPANIWTNNFAPSFDALRAAIQLKTKDKQMALPKDANVQFTDATGKEIKTENDIYNLFSEQGKSGAKEHFRTISLKAKITFAGSNTVKEIELPVKVYKNLYEATESGDMPDFLKVATGANGDLAKILANTKARSYVKVTVDPTKNLDKLKPKSYWVNPAAWVEIPEIPISEDEKKSSRFKHWSADQDSQNEQQASGGVYDFGKRHKFTENTVITPSFGEEQKPADPPSDPQKPSDPAKPSNPQKPSTPTLTPSAPNTSAVPESPTDSPATSAKETRKPIVPALPRTGSSGLWCLVVAAMLSVTGSLLLIRRKQHGHSETGRK